jgi:Zn-dependent peptidase ImmA (M78 family)/transcriptional regulator with XRE-family HTH domain
MQRLAGRVPGLEGRTLASKTAPVTGAVLEWAIRDAGVRLSELADRLDVPEDELRRWMYEDAAPKQTQLRVLAKFLGRPESFFFLPEPPARRPVNAEFRRFAGSDRRPGDQTIEGVRLAQRVQKTQAWVRDRAGEGPVYLPSVRSTDPVEETAQVLRDWLGWTVEAQTGRGKTDASAAKELRSCLQSQGIIALNLTLDEGITRGFSLHHHLSPLVAANTRDPHRARLFSYAHELVHLCLGEDAVCGTLGKQKGLERYCNQVAAAFLMPRDSFLQFKKAKFGGLQISSLKQVNTLRNHFRVSLRAVAIRAESLGVANPGLYDLVDAETKGEQKRRGGSYVPGNERTRPVIRVDQYGHQFINSLFRAEEKGLLRRRQLSEILSVSDQELNTVYRLSTAHVDA